MEEPDRAAGASQDTKGDPPNPTAARGSTSSSLQRLYRPGAARLENKAATSLLRDLNDELRLFSPSLLVLFHP